MITLLNFFLCVTGMLLVLVAVGAGHTAYIDGRPSRVAAWAFRLIYLATGGAWLVLGLHGLTR